MHLRAIQRVHRSLTGKHTALLTLKHLITYFQSWHQDIKPTNILIKSRPGGSVYDFECKLADLGLSHFKKIMSSKGDTADIDVRGTRAYGAYHPIEGEVLPY